MSEGARRWAGFGRVEVDGAGELYIGGVAASALARDHGTPLYVMDETLIRDHCREYRRALAASGRAGRIAYAAKAHLTAAMARLVAEEGLWLDVVSGGELYVALAGGFPAGRVIFHGNGKTPAEVEFALAAGVDRFVVDGAMDLALLAEMAFKAGRRPRVQIRVAPGVETDTHRHVRTGERSAKFGVWPEEAGELAGRAQATGRVRLAGFHCHIGSQLHDTGPFAQAAAVLAGVVRRLDPATRRRIRELNLGGGLGIRYLPGDRPLAIGAFVSAVVRGADEAFRAEGLRLPEVILEPGRSIVGEAGVTLYTVGAIKGRHLAVDGGMADNPRPALYDAEYHAVLVGKGPAAGTAYDVVGKCCESGDVLAREISLPSPRRGDLLAVFSTGAYHHAMASNYNLLPRPAVVFAGGGRARLVVRRESYQDLVARDLAVERLRAAQARPAAAGR